MKKIFVIRSKYFVFIIATVASILLTTCNIFLTPDPLPTPLQASLEWVKHTSGQIMDINQKYIFSSGEVVDAIWQKRAVDHIFTHEGVLISSTISAGGNYGVLLALVTDNEPHFGTTILRDIPTQTSNNRISYLSGYTRTNPYTRYYNTSSLKSDIAPTIARGPKYLYRSGNSGRSTWMVGTFTDKFQPNDFNVNPSLYCPTFGKADCFVLLATPTQESGFAVRSQWGGPENDIAYNIATDAIGNPTIFLRAGSDFGITSATQGIVRMKTGYNVVKLDTNGLLTSTFSLKLEASAEIGDVQLALGKNNTIFLLARDEQRQQYFLLKATPNGTVWTRYFSTNISIRIINQYAPTPRMSMIVDSKENIYLTGSFYGTADFDGTTLQTAADGAEAFLAKYSAANVCLGAVKMGQGSGITIRLSPDENSVYINGYSTVGRILGTHILDEAYPQHTGTRSVEFVAKVKVR